MPATRCSAPSGASGALRPDPPPHPHNPPSGLIRAVAPSVATPLSPPPSPSPVPSSPPQHPSRGPLRACTGPSCPSTSPFHSLTSQLRLPLLLPPTFRLISVLEKTPTDQAESKFLPSRPRSGSPELGPLLARRLGTVVETRVQAAEQRPFRPARPASCSLRRASEIGRPSCPRPGRGPCVTGFIDHPHRTSSV